jgi:hypothetical protein
VAGQSGLRRRPLPRREHERRAAIFLGPEFGTVARADLVDAARERPTPGSTS